MSKIDISIIDASTMLPFNVGYIEMDTFDAEKCFDLCNWGCWTNEKPKELHSNIQSCSHGICFTNPDTHEYWLAKSIGWLVGDIKTIAKYVSKNVANQKWI